MIEQMLTAHEVGARCGISRTTIYRLMRDGVFPRPIPAGRRAVRWLEREVVGWQEQQMSAREADRDDGKK